MSPANVFLVYMPPRNPEAMVHYEDTIKRRVLMDRITPHLSSADANELREVFGPRPVAIWGSRDSPTNRAKFAKMQQGDSLLIVEGAKIKLMGKIALKVVSAELSRELWKSLRGETEAGWDLIYFIANPLEIDVPFVKFCRLFGYEENYQLRGLTLVSEAKLAAFYHQYDDLYSVLIRVRDGQKIEKRPPKPDLPPAPPLAAEQGIESAPTREVSDHVRMQCKLAKLGAKAGQKVWIPLSDRERLRDVCDFDNFEKRFSAGIDLPITYVENIDVVWKEEFRIDAAYEVENTTGIYSGLLRFADLSIVAPNSPYPMFIVAPATREDQLRRQLRRPSFEQLKIRERVLFLPYEEIDEIEKFFGRSEKGLSADVMRARARKID